MRQFATLIALSALLVIPLTAQSAKKEVLVNFAGSLKRVTRKEVVIQSDSDNEMTFIRTKKTTFLSGGRPMDGAGLPFGITVNVEAFERLNRELEAVTVSVAVPADHSPNK
jgi:hypothetical protein